MGKNALWCLLLSLSALTFVCAEDVPKPAGFHGEFLTQLDGVEKKIVSLAGAVPKKYSWRPNEGVRSVGEVFAHLASANYGIPILLGMKPPAGLDRDAETKIKSKTAVSIPDSDLDKEVRMLGGKMVTIRHEHLGQSIAYARMNNVIPSWSTGKNE